MRLFGRRWLGVLAFALLVVLWGSTFSFLKVALEYSPPVLFVGFRTVTAGGVITLAALLWGGPPNLRRDWRVFGLLALLNVLLFTGLQTFAVMYLPSGTAAVLIYLQPILVGFLAWPMLGETLPVRKVTGLFLGFAGIAVVCLGGLPGSGGEVTLAGFVTGISSALFWALGTVVFKRYEARISTLWAVATSFLVGGAALLVLGLVLEPVSSVEPTGAFVASLLYVSVGGTGVAWLLFLALVRAGEASRVASYIFLVPLVAVVLGALFLGERVGLSLLFGAALVVAGIYLVNAAPSKARTDAS